MASHEENDHLPEETQGYKLSQPKQSLAERHPGHRGQSVGRCSGQEDSKLERGSLPSWLPQEIMSPEVKVDAWLAGKEPYDRTHYHRGSAPIPSSTQNINFTPPAPSGHSFAIRKSKSIASLLHRAAPNSSLRVSLHLYPTLFRDGVGNSNLDLGLTCRGLPNMMIKREVTTISSKRPIGGSPEGLAQAASAEVIYRFQDSLVITPDENVKVTKFEADANDESLQRYKKSLGLGGGKDLSDPNDSRVCIIQSLTMESPGRPPVTIDLSQAGSENTLKDKPFKIKEGAKFTMVASFRVQHEILSGLQYVQIVKRKGIRVSKDSEMLGSYAPNTDKQPVYTKRFQEEDAPSGMIARGHYNAVSTFVDDDKKQHLQFEWSFDISKDW
ncbi:hypothetical protein NUW58_g7351 [Xylaria curta]|uniref:Uncharacterized protein n=1 Tax=Xylaria curta TaxID=42375 RepID=A0ACC1NIY0_9PEZI|nr:hypothetical protein NUW58_g7351 [Xylaria curta]